MSVTPNTAENPAEPDSAGFILPTTMISRFLDRVIDRIGVFFSWIWLLLVGVILVQVILRYGFNQGSIKLEEVQWHLYAIGIMVSLSYGITHDRHVRIDLLYEKFPDTVKAWIELIGICLFLLPFLGFVLWESIPYVYASYSSNEVSVAPDGLPHRFLIKSFIPIGFGLMIMASVSRLSRVIGYLIGWHTPPESDSPVANERPTDMAI